MRFTLTDVLFLIHLLLTICVTILCVEILVWSVLILCNQRKQTRFDNNNRLIKWCQKPESVNSEDQIWRIQFHSESMKHQLRQDRTEDSRQNVNDVLSNIDINTVIRDAVQKELNKLGVVGNVNMTWWRNDYSLALKLITLMMSNAIRCRTTHEAAGNSRTDLNRSVRDGCPDSSVLARHNQIEPGIDNRHK